MQHAGLVWDEYLDSGLIEVVGFQSWGKGVVPKSLGPIPIQMFGVPFVKHIPIAVLMVSPA